MDKKSGQASATEAKLESLGANKPTKEDPLSGAKKAFEEAVSKTNDGLKADGEEVIVVESNKPKPKVDVKPTPKKAEPDPVKLELERLKKELAEVKSKAVEPPPKKEEPKQSDFDVVQAELSEQFGEEEGKILAHSLRALLEPREQRISQLEQLINRAVEQSKTHAAKTNRSRLSKDYPHLSESDEAWKIVETQAQAAFSTGAHTSHEEAFDSVAQALYGSAKAKAEEEVEEVASQIAASTPTQPSSARRERKLSNNAQMRAVFDHLFKTPEDISGAKRLAKDLRIEPRD